MRQKQRDSPSRSAAGLTEGGRAGPGSWERDGSLSVPDTLESPPAGPAGAHLPGAPDLAGQAAPEPENMAQPKSDCRSPVGLDCCNCCLDLAHRSGLQRDNGGDNNNSGSPTVSNFRQLQEKLVFENLNTDKLNSIMRQDSLEPVLRDPCYLINEGICNRNIDQTMLSILLFFHRAGAWPREQIPRHDKDQVMVVTLFFSGSKECATPGLEGASGASVVAIDNKIEQAMDLVKNHLMYAVREEVEILKEQIRELVEKNSQLERENTLLKTLASPEQLEKFQSRLSPEEPAPETPETPEAPGGSAV
ncbi:TSC22 domain family protein 3 isoform X1 [Cervus elaphus]|uniref:TSC22 domain family protein 3 isoform X1 n=2 Tax=Cervus canadensis TaxID=1574408 RepID=UPI001CA323C2|nr:TSC22 domain family protein 3 isoform X1 [Cervus canadensis]XP_043751600.1 TSC22 domain family protein 3 isoform X1 [Cervus elaphus]